MSIPDNLGSETFARIEAVHEIIGWRRNTSRITGNCIACLLEIRLEFALRKASFTRILHINIKNLEIDNRK